MTGYGNTEGTMSLQFLRSNRDLGIIGMDKGLRYRQLRDHRSNLQELFPEPNHYQIPGKLLMVVLVVLLQSLVKLLVLGLPPLQELLIMSAHLHQK